MVAFETLCAVSYSPSIVTVLHQFPNKARYCRKSWFFIPPLHSTPPLGRSPSEYCHSIWSGKTRMVGLPDGEKLWGYNNRLHTIPACDGQTDILPRHSPRYAYASRGKNYWLLAGLSVYLSTLSTWIMQYCFFVL